MVKQNVLFSFNIILKIIVVVFYAQAIIQSGPPGERVDIWIIQIIGFILEFFIILCHSTKNYTKFKTFYYASILGELIVTFIFSLIIAAWIVTYPLHFNISLFIFNIVLIIMNIIASIMGIGYFFLKRAEIRGIKPRPETLEKLRDILNVSNKIKLKRVQNVLNLDDKSFDVKIIEWANDFGFRIDGEYLITQGESVDAFINSLEKQFTEWNKLEKNKDGKV